jgi:hypothetical protein
MVIYCLWWVDQILQLFFFINHKILKKLTYHIILCKSYRKWFQTIITDAKLNTIIQNTTYDKLFDMLGSVFDIK